MRDDDATSQLTLARALANVSRALISSHEPREILDLILGHVRALLRARKAMLFQVGTDERIRVAASQGLTTPIRELLPAHDRDGLAMTAMTERRTVASSDVLNDAGVQLSPVGRRFVEREGVRAALGIPLLAHTETLGAMMAYRDEAGPFSAGDVEAAEALAALASVVLERGRVGAVEVARLRQDQALVDVEREVLAELTTERLFPLILERAGLLVNARGTIYLVEPGRPWLRRAWSTWLQSGEGLRVGEGITGVCAESRRGLLVADYPAWAKAHGAYVGFGVRTAIAQPLLSRGELLGVITMSRTAKEARPFEPSDLAILQRFAGQAALALRNATLYEQAEQRRAALLDSEGRYRELFENSNDAMATTSLDGRFTSVNRAMEALLGWSREDIVGKDSGFVGTPALVAEWNERTRRALEGERLPRIWETEMLQKGGRKIRVECRTRFLRDPAGTAVGIEGTYRDITARKEMEAALRRAKDAAESASRAKSSFLANMSHELRTPLNAILGYAQVLKRDRGLAPRQEKAVTVIEQSGEHLLGLINEVLDLAKIEAGSLAIHVTTFDLPRLLDGLFAMMRPRAEGKGLGFTAEWSADVPAAVCTDERWLRQVLVNLLDNAIKYTEAGGVGLSVAPHEGRVRFVVEDSGLGIAAEHLAGIFEPFHQVRDDRRFVEGAGLGLAISRTLVGLLGGNLQVASRPGRGSRFWFDLDLPEASTAELASERLRRRVAGARGDRRRILVVDDREDNRRLLRELLVPAGFEVVEASDGPACLALAERLRPDAILLDLRMPGMDGFEVTRRLRASEREGRAVIVAVSASAFEHHREQCLEAGADDFIAKPFRVEALLELLCRHLGLEPVYEEEQTVSIPPAPDAALAPPPAELADLLDLARRGNIRRILESTGRLETDGRYPAFTTELRSLAQRFRIKELCQFLERAGGRG